MRRSRRLVSAVSLGWLAAALAACSSAPPRSPTAGPAPSAAGSWRLVFASDVSGDLDVYVARVPGGKPRRVVGVAGRDELSPTWSPDGATIAFRRNPPRSDDGEIMVVPARGGRSAT